MILTFLDSLHMNQIIRLHLWSNHLAIIKAASKALEAFNVHVFIGIRLMTILRKIMENYCV